MYWFLSEFHVHNTFFKGLTNKDNSFYLPAKVRGTEKKQGELLPEKGCLFPIEPISGNNQPSYFIIYSVGESPNFFLKQELKYLGSLKPTAYAKSAIRIFFFSSISRQAACKRTLLINAEGVSPVNSFNLSASVVRAYPSPP